MTKRDHDADAGDPRPRRPAEMRRIDAPVEPERRDFGAARRSGEIARLVRLERHTR